MIGEVKMFVGANAPDGWAFCDGQSLPIASFGSLFRIMGNAYGGDGRTTFALPDLRGRVPVGVGQGAGLTDYRLGNSGGAESVELLTAQMPEHSHGVNAVSALGNTQHPAGAYLADAAAFDNDYSTDNPDVVMSNGMIASAGSGAAHENRQPYLCVGYIIALYGCVK